jgi:hypothetical protein
VGVELLKAHYSNERQRASARLKNLGNRRILPEFRYFHAEVPSKGRL